MSTDFSYQRRKQVLWGLLLIGLGALFYFDRMGFLDVDEVWHYWPLVLVAVGINKMIGYPTARDFSSGLWMMFVGLWLFATFENLWGLTFYNSWPFLIIAWGAELVIEPFIKTRFAQNKEHSNEK